MLVMLKLECKNVNYENEINICLEFLYDNNYGTPCICLGDDYTISAAKYNIDKFSIKT